MDNVLIDMSILKKVGIKKIFRDAGFSRVTNKSIIALEDAVAGVLRQIAEDAAKVYKGDQVESRDLAQLSDIKVYRVRTLYSEPSDLDVKKLVRDETMPEGWDDGEDIVIDEENDGDAEKEQGKGGDTSAE